MGSGILSQLAPHLQQQLVPFRGGRQLDSREVHVLVREGYTVGGLFTADGAVLDHGQSLADSVSDGAVDSVVHVV